MPIPVELKPQRRERVIDLVERAGLDVSDWANYKHGKENPGANPKYCYEWALWAPGRVVVCNLWYSSMEETAGGVEQHLTLRDTAEHQETDPTRRARRGRMEKAIVDAYQGGLPVRVIVLDGKRRGVGPNGKTKVDARSLDPLPWAVVSFDANSGAIVLRRGAPAFAYADQFSLPPPSDGAAALRTATVAVRARSVEVRQHVLQRADGRCEYCGKPGFPFADGRVYLETHHVEPLSTGGADSVNNVIALCADHHREAHYGARAKEMKKDFLSRIEPEGGEAEPVANVPQAAGEPMAKYFVELKGEPADLEEFPIWFPDGSLFVQVEQDRYYLHSDEIASSSSPERALEFAEAALDQLYAVGLLLWPSLHRPSVEAVVEETDDGQRRRYLFASVHEALRLKDRFNATVDGVVQTPQRPTDAQRLLAASLRGRHVQTAMLIWSDPRRTWPRLYRIIEELESELGSSVSKAGLCSDNERDRLKQSANSAEVAGSDSRHAVGKFSPPRRPMSLPEATGFVGTLLQKTLLVVASRIAA